MTCFWSGILQNLNKEDYQLIGLEPIRKHNTNEMKNFIKKLKKLSEESEFNITWQNSELSDREKEELRIYIKEYNENGIGAGHLTSSCDPFLCLLADRLKCKIEFHYIKNKIIFQSKDSVRRTIKFRGTRGHFSRG